MWPDQVSNLGPLTYESGALPIALRGPAFDLLTWFLFMTNYLVMIITCAKLCSNPIMHDKVMGQHKQVSLSKSKNKVQVQSVTLTFGL